MTFLEMSRYIPDALIPIALLLLLLGGWIVVRKNSATSKNAYFIFYCGPLIFTTIFLLCLLPDGPLLLRLCFLSGAIFLPASLYFLFIAARRESLFNAFTTNLTRLGLLRLWSTAGPSQKIGLAEPNNRNTTFMSESRTCFRARIKSYFDRFGAVYGSLEKDNVEKLLKAVEHECGILDADVRGEAPRETLSAGGEFDFPTIIPVLGATCLLALGWICVLPPEAFKRYNGGDFSQWFREVVVPTASPVVFAFLGAYFFSLQMIIKRFVRHDLGANAYNAISLRIILAVVGVWIAMRTFEASGYPVNDKSAIVLVASFAIGGFPLVVWQLVTSALKKFPPFHAALPGLTSPLPLSYIDGLSYWAQTRLEEEDIECVPNLATADLVDLMLNTKIPPHRIIDWVDQAILLTYLGREKKEGEAGLGSAEKESETSPLRNQLRKYGIRTATALERAFSNSSAPGESASPLPDLDKERDRLHSIVAAMRDCPNFILVRNWRGIADHPETEVTAEQRTIAFPAATKAA
jgi:hypothetical protein